MNQKRSESTEQSLRLLGERVYKTYLARLYTERRLRLCGQWWDAAQFTLAGALIAVSVISLVSELKTSTLFPAFMVILAVLSLTVAIVVSSVSYAARSRDMFGNYRGMQALSVELETLIQSKASLDMREVQNLQARYNFLLDQSENHLPIDHAIATAGGLRNLPFAKLLQYLVPFLLPTLLMIFSAWLGRSSELVRLVHPVGTQFRRPGTVARFRVF